MPTLSPAVTPFYGGTQTTGGIGSIPTVGAPSTANINHPLGTLALDNAAAKIYGLASKTGGVATWVLMSGGGGSGVISTINSIMPTIGGNFIIESTDATITITPVANGINLSAAASELSKVTGNSGGVVVPDGSSNINIVGQNTSGINAVGNLSPNTLTIEGIAASPTQIGTVALSSNAQAAAQIANLPALTPSNIPVMFSTHPLIASQGGTGLISPTAHTILVAEGASNFTPIGPLTNGQLIIGSTGADPVAATLIQGSGIVITNGAGTITIAATVSGSTTYNEDAGSATPSANILNVLGTALQGITTSGAGSTITISATNASTSQIGVAAHSTNVLAAAQTSTTTTLTPSNITSMFSTTPLPATQGGTGLISPTAHTLLISEGTSAFNTVGPLTNGQLLIGSTGIDPVAATLTQGAGITITNGAGTITIASGGTVATTYDADSGSATPSAGILTIAGTALQGITTSGAGSTITINATSATTGQIGVSALATNVLAAAQASTTTVLTPSNIPSMFSTTPLPATQGGTGLISPTAHTILIAEGAGNFTPVGPLINGQLLIGATGSNPVAANLATGQGISAAPGFGTITLSTLNEVALEYIPNSGTSPLILTGAILNLVGNATQGVSTVGSANTITITVADATTTTLGVASFNAAQFTVTAGAVSLLNSSVTWSTISASQTLAVNQGYICISPGGALALALPAVSAVGAIIDVALNGATSFQVTQGAGQQITIGSSQTTLGAGGSITSTALGDSIRMVCWTANTFWQVLSSIGNFTVV